MHRTTGVALLAVLLGGSATASGAELKLFGSITGQVRNTAGVGQMGASVMLMNRYEKVIQRILTAPDGRFRFDALAPDSYSIRVSLSSFVPAMRGNVPVRAGMESYLSIQLANLFSSIELVYTAPGQSGVLSEDWKWVLRSSTSTRPVLRLREYDSQWRNASTSSSSSSGTPSMLNSFNGMVRVSAGDQGNSSALGAEPDLGTAFALATSVFGTSEIRFSGNVGYATSVGAPTAGFRTRYSPGLSGSGAPDVELTVRQTAVRQRAGQGFMTGNASQEIPVLRTMSLKLGDRKKITESLTLEYGAMLESVAFIDRLNIFSPFGRLTYDLGNAGEVEFGYSSGAPALDLISSGAEQDALMGLAMFPRLSVRHGHARVQRNETYEVGYRKVSGSRTYSASVYQDAVNDGAVMATASGEMFMSPDLLPDIASNSSILNMGNYRTAGYQGSVAQKFLDEWTATLSLGAAGMLSPDAAEQSLSETGQARSRMRPVSRPWASARVAGILPVTGTRIATSYLWTPGGSLGPAHSYLTQRTQPQMGLNIQVRQPIPFVGNMLGRLEMTAELRNLLAQGYVPIAASDGGTLLLIQFPRTVRGGISFIF
jgi:hypothetical protein